MVMVSVLRAPGCEDVNEQWFSPTYWGGKAEPVSAGGRGSAWFVHSPCGQLVLRHYRRGGMVARVSERRYLFTGEERSRSFAEFRLLRELHDQGLPVPRPVAALVAKRGAFSYEAAILIERIEGALPMPEHPEVSSEALWHRVGQVIARFHCAGLDHVDLNCDNILVAGERIFLIDFDRCRLHPDADRRARWKERNLSRLRRSVEKRVRPLQPARLERLWQALIAGYESRITDRNA